MDENIKQRLVGAAVLVALAVIFLPALFDKDERVAIDTTSQIPPAPTIETVEIPRPTKPEGIRVPPAGTLFQPEVVENAEKEPVSEASNQSQDRLLAAAEVSKSEPKKNTTVVQAEEVEAKPEPLSKPAPKPAPKVKPEPKKVAASPKAPTKPRLSDSGVPLGWVVQAASFKSDKAAQDFTDRLAKADYKSYFRPVETSKGKYFRVFIGPYVDEQQAIDVKRVIDKAYKVRSQVLRFNPISGN